MIPVPIADGKVNTLSPDVKYYTGSLLHYFAEDARTARRFLRLLHPELPLEPIQISVIDKHNGIDKSLLYEWIKKGYSIGVLSESGCPGIADPGAEIAAIAQYKGVKVIPLVGPSSIILSLMASGLNGQSFAFNGYLPVKDPQRSKRLKELEARSEKEQQTQIFIETPYRNTTFAQEILKHCNNSTRLCIASNITADNSTIITKAIADWKKQPPILDKVPTVFLLLA